MQAKNYVSSNKHLAKYGGHQATNSLSQKKERANRFHNTHQIDLSEQQQVGQYTHIKSRRQLLMASGDIQVVDRNHPMFTEHDDNQIQSKPIVDGRAMKEIARGSMSNSSI